MNRLIYSPEARADLRAINCYIAADSPDSAERFVAELSARGDEIAAKPELCSRRDDLAPGLRAARYGRYLLFFRHVGDEVRIVRVLHGARDLPQIFGN